MRINLIIGLAFALLIAGCSSKPASQGAQPSGAAATVAPAQAPAAKAAAPAPGAPATAAEKPSGVAVATPTNPGAAPAAAAPVVASASPAAKAAAGPVKSPPASPATKSAAPAVAKSAPPTLDLASLTQRLKDTNAIGVLSKIAIKNQVDDLLDQFRAFYEGKLKTTLAELRRPYDLLVLKVLSLLQDSDPGLASAIVASREAIWGILADPKKFATVS
jgi:hypothetical protein